MSGPRIYLNQPLSPSQENELDAQAVMHLVRVLRMKDGDALRLFNGDGHEYPAQLVVTGKKTASARVLSQSETDAELPLPIHLGQVISKGDRMDFVLQKATELGVAEITPLFSERCDVKLNQERLEKKVEHWQKVITSACEQCGRNRLPQLNAPQSLQDWTASVEAARKFILHPHNQQPLNTSEAPSSVAILVGPEGGFSDTEVKLCEQQDFSGLLLGPRILRTETAPLAAVSVMQFLWGDFR